MPSADYQVMCACKQSEMAAKSWAPLTGMSFSAWLWAQLTGQQVPTAAPASRNGCHADLLHDGFLCA